MTTTVTVRHDGPDHANIRIEALGNCQPQGIRYLTKEGQEFTGYFWTGGVFVITEVPAEDPPQQ